MCLLCYDFYDLHRVFLNIRLEPLAAENTAVVKRLRQVLASLPDDHAEDNRIRRALAAVLSPELERWQWVFVNNIYTYHGFIQKEPVVYAVLCQAVAELELCIKEGNEARVVDLADALHNLPLYFAKERRGLKRQIRRDAAGYRKKWNARFLADI